MNHIQAIEVKGLWGHLNLYWELSGSVNILSGGNGSGKSTVLRCLCDLFKYGSISPQRRGLIHFLEVTLSDGTKISSSSEFDKSLYNVDIISTFDVAMATKPQSGQNGGGIEQIETQLDWELFKLEKRYLTYQLSVGRQVISALSSGLSVEEINCITSHKNLFFDTLDSLFAHTHKTIDRGQDNLLFTLPSGRVITPAQLSSGEKQILMILTTALVQNRKESVMIMDEPEISLHFDWQKRLLDDILQLNPNLQLIVATHSPALVMGGWVDRVSEIEELLKD